MRYSLFLAVVLGLLLMTLGGCTATVVTQVSEFDANEVASLLMGYGLSAKKSQGTEQNFDVVVPQGELARALSLLVDAGLPREKHESLASIFKREGMVSTQTEEHIRYVQGLSQELERTLTGLDGVASARVHVVIPQPDLYSNVRRPSSASVLVRYRKTTDPATFGPLVRSLVVRAVEGLEPEQVAIALAPIAAVGANMPPYESVLGLRMAPDSVVEVVALLGASWVLLVLVLVLFLRPTLWRWLRRTFVERLSWRGRMPDAAASTKRVEPGASNAS